VKEIIASQERADSVGNTKSGLAAGGMKMGVLGEWAGHEQRSPGSDALLTSGATFDGSISASCPKPRLMYWRNDWGISAKISAGAISFVRPRLKLPISVPFTPAHDGPQL
jgi:hypothetical protein